ncbi:hypothetical protein F2Q69_00027822 [Brassica cretica]|uniref:Dolichyl-diphosphooligosaccharide--protein glycosyltransferase subunit DAD1 n=1 Tax=Brassica cretica TaxID=69181 RepID=A0A8S9SB58_BRACR|nr:hypothetical protein F2Q69_00027822 [Brassica cretica]
MVKSTSKDAQDLFRSLHSAYSATPTNLKIIDMYVVFAVFTALIQVAYMALVGSFPFNSFLSGVLSCVGTAVLAVCLRIQVNKENKEFKFRHLENILGLGFAGELDSRQYALVLLGLVHRGCELGMGINWSLFPTANTINIVIIFIIRSLAMQCISYNYPESPTSWLLLGILLQDLAPERAFADFVLCNLVLHLVIINFLG